MLALESFLPTHLAHDAAGAKLFDAFLLKVSKEQSIMVKKFFMLVIKLFPTSLLVEHKKKILIFLFDNALKNKNIAVNDPEVRRNALASLGGIAVRLRGLLEPADLSQIFGVLEKALNDHTIDRRGDIALIVREQVVICLHELLIAIYEDETEPRFRFAEGKETELLERCFGMLICAIFEPNDRLRLRAGFVLQCLTNSTLDKMPAFQDKELFQDKFNSKKLSLIFEEHQKKFFQDYDVSLIEDKQFLAYTSNEQFVYFWNIPQCSFAYLIDFISNARYGEDALKSFVLSLSSSLEATAVASAEALKAHLSQSTDRAPLMIKRLLNVFKKNLLKEKFFVAVLRSAIVVMKLNLIENP